MAVQLYCLGLQSFEEDSKPATLEPQSLEKPEAAMDESPPGSLCN